MLKVSFWPIFICHDLFQENVTNLNRGGHWGNFAVLLCLPFSVRCCGEQTKNLRCSQILCAGFCFKSCGEKKLNCGVAVLTSPGVCGIFLSNLWCAVKLCAITCSCFLLHAFRILVVLPVFIYFLFNLKHTWWWCFQFLCGDFDFFVRCCCVFWSPPLPLWILSWVV